jgi:hypothetical protein
MAKFVVYEKTSETIYQYVDKSTTSDVMQTVINLGSGLTAGFAAAIVSQPADTMLSKINKSKVSANNPQRFRCGANIFLRVFQERVLPAVLSRLPRSSVLEVHTLVLVLVFSWSVP